MLAADVREVSRATHLSRVAGGICGYGRDGPLRPLYYNIWHALEPLLKSVLAYEMFPGFGFRCEGDVSGGYESGRSTCVLVNQVQRSVQRCPYTQECVPLLVYTLFVYPPHPKLRERRVGTETPDETPE